MEAPTLQEQALQCKHCKEPLLHTKITGPQDTFFCCTGCLKVWNLIQGDGLDFYYQLSELQNSAPPSPEDNPGYQEFLNWIKQTPIESLGTGNIKGSIHSLELESTNITCSACGWLLEKVLSPLPGIKNFRVDFIQGTLALEYDSSVIALSDILAKAYKLGYPFRFAHGTPNAQTKDPLSAKIVVSAAAFVNVMTFSLAQYLGLAKEASSLDTFFTFVSFSLSIPVVFWCATPFYQRAWNGLRQGYLHMDLPVSLGVLITFMASTFWFITGTGENYYDSVVSLVFFLLVGRWGLHRFEKNMAQNGSPLLEMQKLQVRLIHKNKTQWISASDIKQGDQIILSQDNICPVDSVLQNPFAWANTSFLTGESNPQKISGKQTFQAGYINLKGDILLTATTNVTGSRTSKYLQSLDSLSPTTTPVDHKVEKIVPWFTGAILALCLLSFVIHWDKSLSEILNYTVSLLIVTCPCALALALPLSYALGMSRAFKRGFLLKSPFIFDNIGGVKAFLFDKTGTLTFAERKIKKWHWLEPDKEIQQNLLRDLKALTKNNYHPISLTLYKSLKGITATDHNLGEVQEIAHRGLFGYSKDGKEYLTLEKGNQTAHPSIPFTPDSIITFKGQVMAGVLLSEEIKPSVPKLITQLKSLYRTYLVSGDNQKKVQDFAQKIPFHQVFSDTSPEQKYELLKSTQTSVGKVMAIGDGINDAKLLKAADVGMAVQGSSSEVRKGADILFVQNNFQQIFKLLQISKSIPTSIKTCYLFSFFYNSIAIYCVFAGVITPLIAAILMPLSTLSICFTAWVTVKR